MLLFFSDKDEVIKSRKRPSFLLSQFKSPAGDVKYKPSSIVSMETCFAWKSWNYDKRRSRDCDATHKGNFIAKMKAMC